MVGLFATLACVADRPVRDVSEGKQASDERSYPLGTVGGELRRYPLTFDRVRAWYGIRKDLEVQARSDTSWGVSLQFPLDSSLSRQIDLVESDARLSSTLQAHSMSPREFVLLTVLLGTGWLSLHFEDSLGTGAAPRSIDPRLVELFRRHRTELESLERAVESVRDSM